MKKKDSDKGIILLMIVTAFVTAGGSYAYFNHQYQINKTQVPQDFQKIVQLYKKIQQNYVGQVDNDTLIDGAMKGMTEAIGDPYSIYMEKDEAKKLDDSLSSSITGIGATMTMVDGKAQVLSFPKKDTPAAKSGLKEGDILIKVEDKPLDGLSLDEIVALVRGEAGTTVSLQVQRGSEKLDFKIKREKVAIETVSSKMLNKDTGYLKIQNFADETAEEFKEKSLELQKQGAKKFVLDVRQNPGGFLDQVISMGSMILKEDQVIVKWMDKKGTTFESKASSEDSLGFHMTEPLAILVDGSSASASEILAGAIKDNKRGKVIGQSTFGKGTMQDIEGGAREKLKLTTGKWFTPNGTTVNGKGLSPDITVDYPEYAYLPPINPKLTYHLGDKNELVTGIKMMMNGLGYSLEKNDQFDESLVAALKDYQEKNKLPVSGTWEEKTSQLVQDQLMKKIKDTDPFIDKALEVLGSKDE